MSEADVGGRGREGVDVVSVVPVESEDVVVAAAIVAAAVEFFFANEGGKVPKMAGIRYRFRLTILI